MIAFIAFSVYGTPAPQGSKKHVGRGIMIESSKKVLPWRQDVKYAALEAVKNESELPIDAAIAVSIDFFLARPKSAKKTALSCKKPDIDKLIRSTFDAIGEAGIWTDDSRVVRIVASKRYADHRAPGAVIQIWEIEP